MGLLRYVFPGLYDGPARGCVKCGGKSFTETEGRAGSLTWTEYVCNGCEWRNRTTFGGCWRADPPEGVDEPSALRR